MRKELTILMCCLAIVTCVGFFIGIYGELESSKVIKPTVEEDTEIDISEEIVPDSVNDTPEYEVNTVENSEYLEEYIAEGESESAERAEEISEDFGNSISIYTIADIPVDSEEDI